MYIIDTVKNKIMAHTVKEFENAFKALNLGGVDLIGMKLKKGFVVYANAYTKTGWVHWNDEGIASKNCKEFNLNFVQNVEKQEKETNP